VKNQAATLAGLSHGPVWFGDGDWFGEVAARVHNHLAAPEPAYYGQDRATHGGCCMSFRPWKILAATMLAACGSPDATGVSLASTDASFAHTQDLEGTPDLIVDAQKLATSWVIYDELVPNVCSAEEGGVTPGQHRLLRFTVTTPNIGDADVYIGDPNEHYDPDGNGDPEDGDGLFELATCHAHYHFRNYASYELIEMDNGAEVATIFAAKRGFCMIDVTPYGSSGSWQYRNCGRPEIPSLGLPAIAGNQGISVNWGDTYVKWLAGQYFVIDDVGPGTYLIRIVVNPPFEEEAGQVCPFKDGAGLCHMFEESDYTNNVGEALITIPKERPGKTGYGPGGNQPVPSNAWTQIEK
jgi:hypothetical protein